MHLYLYGQEEEARLAKIRAIATRRPTSASPRVVTTAVVKPKLIASAHETDPLTLLLHEAVANEVSRHPEIWLYNTHDLAAIN